MSTNRIRVLSLIEGRVVTAPAKILLTFADECRERVDVTMATFVRQAPGEADGTHRNALIDAARQLDLPVVAIAERGPYDRAALARLKNVFRELRPDIVQSNSVKSHFLVSLSRPRAFGWLAFHHGYTAEDLKMRLYNQLDRWSLRACDRVVTVCDAFARDVVRIGIPRDKISVIPNGIRADSLARQDDLASATRARFGIPPDGLLVLSAGRLSPEKGHRYLIDAVARLRATGGGAPAFRVLLAGDGLLRATLAEQVKAAKLEDCVQLIGHQPDIKPLFMAADVFVLPSLSEGSPMVLLESMAAGVPVLATRVGGIPEAVTNEQTALLVPAADPAALSGALRRLLDEPVLRRRLVSAARERVTTAFSPELYNHRVLSAFEAVRRSPVSHAPEGVQVQS